MSTRATRAEAFLVPRVGIATVPRALSIDEVFWLTSILYCTIGIGKGEEGQSLSTKVALPGVNGGVLTFLPNMVVDRRSLVDRWQTSIRLAPSYNKLSSGATRGIPVV